jgi:uncharacterized protein YgbK (DUF1537 family)
MPLLLGCIADDITGASDLGLMLSSNGLPTTLYLGVPDADRIPQTEAVVIALKIRTCPPHEAIAAAEAAARWLMTHDARQYFYKYCSTFDSTAKGNIGPVSDTLLRLLGADLTVLLPAFPENGRTVRQGYLYVGDQQLSESSMRNHPLTPMTESFLPKLMDSQTAVGMSGWIGQKIVDAGATAIRSELAAERKEGHRYVSIDTRTDDDLQSIAEATSDLRLLTGGSGIGAAIPNTLRRMGLLHEHATSAPLPALPGYTAILAGSCSQATRAQIATFSNGFKSIIVDPLALHEGSISKESLADAAMYASASGNVLIYSSTDPDSLRMSQQKIGVAASAALVEDTLAFIARHLADHGIAKFVVAGGETSGAIAQALQIDELEISEQIAPGVPWMIATSPHTRCLAFKSGNFGQADFFDRALELLP